MIAYKVVMIDSDSKFKSLYVMTKGFELTYSIGEVVSAHPDTVGVFCFKTLPEASAYFYGDKHSAILTVQGFGKPFYPRFVAATPSGGAITIFKHQHTAISIPDILWPELPHDFREKFSPPPLGTICFPQIRVLKKVK